MLLRLYEDFRHALRLIRGNPTLSLAVFLSLTLAIGASASMFGAVDSFLLRPLPVPQSSNVVQVTSVSQGNATGDVSYPDFEDLQKRATSFESLATARVIGAAIRTHN